MNISKVLKAIHMYRTIQLVLIVVTVLFGFSGNVVAQDRMYWVSVGDIKRSDLDGSNQETFLNAATSGSAVAITLDQLNGKAYWMTNNSVRRADIHDGGNIEILTSGFSGALSNFISLDVDGGKMYYGAFGRVRRADLDGTNVELLYEVSGISNIFGPVLDTQAGKMYWAITQPGLEKIVRADLDGSNIEDLIISGLDAVNGIALDASGGKLYWTSSSTTRKVVSRANLDGTGVEDLVDDPSRSVAGVTLDVAAGKLYFIDPQFSTIFQANLDGSDLTSVLTGIGVNALKLALELDSNLPPPPSGDLSAQIIEKITFGSINANDDSFQSSISADGTKVAFSSRASNLVSGDINGTQDIFVHDRVTGVTRRISIANDGIQGNGYSFFPSISDDGTKVAFVSSSSNLVVGDTNGTQDIFVHDLVIHETRRISITSDGTQANGSSGQPVLSAYGRRVAFISMASNLVSGDTNGKIDIFVHDLVTGQTRRVSIASNGTQANEDNYQPAISVNGKVAFSSDASNLVGGDTNGAADIFVHDLSTGVTRRTSIANDGMEGNGSSVIPSISNDGTKVAFRSDASNLVGGDTNGVADMFVHDLVTGETSRVSIASDETQANNSSGVYLRSLSADGTKVAFDSFASNLVSGDTNRTGDIFVHDLVSGETQRVSIVSDGSQADSWSQSPSISADSTKVVFRSLAGNLVNGDTNGESDIFVHDLSSGETRRVSIVTDNPEADNQSMDPSISDDGTKVAFRSDASNLVGGDTNGVSDIFVHDLVNDVTRRVSIASDGTEANNVSFQLPSISADGAKVAYLSRASNLVSGDTNGTDDIFVHDLVSGVTQRVSIASGGTQANGQSRMHPSLNANGTKVAFVSGASNLVSGDTNGTDDIFVHDLVSEVTLRVSIASDGTEGNSESRWPSLSADGTKVAFLSHANNLVSGDTNGKQDIFVLDLVSGVTQRVSIATDGTEANDSNWDPSLSGDGGKVAFASGSSNLVSGDTNGVWDIFVHNLGSGVTQRVSIASDGTEGNGIGGSFDPSFSADGTKLAFGSDSNNLVSGDTNGTDDIFIHDLVSGEIHRVTVTREGVEANSYSYLPSLNAKGTKLAFVSDADNLTNDDTNGTLDIFFYSAILDTDHDGIADLDDPCPGDYSNTCDPDKSTAEFIPADEGGELATTDGTVTVDIPEYALGKDSVISVTDATATTGSSTLFIQSSDQGTTVGYYGVEINPEGTVFNTPITLVFSWDDADNDGIVDGINMPEENLQVTKDGIAITGKCIDEPPLDGVFADCDIAANTFTFQVSSLSLFVLGEILEEPVDVLIDPVPVSTTLNPVPVNTLFALNARFGGISTPLEQPVSSAQYSINGTAAGLMTPVNTAGSIQSFSAALPGFSEPGVYNLCVQGFDEVGNTIGEEECQFVAVYDPSAGFVTGGGWIESPLGAYAAEPSLAGKATFGFVSKYKKGQNTPDGNTQFQFKAGDLNFHSESYDWLVVAGAKAQFKGEGVINGDGGFGFMITATDSAINGGGDIDKFRMKIWYLESDAVVYDNQMGALENADPSTEIKGGNIVIHKK